MKSAVFRIIIMYGTVLVFDKDCRPLLSPLDITLCLMVGRFEADLSELLALSAQITSNTNSPYLL